MRRWAFIIFVAGVFLMFVFANLPPEQISSASDLYSLELNTRISIFGKVTNERIIYPGTRLLDLDNGITVLCECEEDFADKEINVVGKISDYEGKRQIVAEEILF
jgi:hypothetical protein